MKSTEPTHSLFDKIRQECRRLFSTDRGRLTLYASPLSSFDQFLWDHVDRYSICEFGTVPTVLNSEKYRIFAMHELPHELRFYEDCDGLHSYISTAGAMLTPAILSNCAPIPTLARDRWLSLLWHLAPPPESHLNNSPAVLFQGRSPHEVSALAIESCRLHTESPSWPVAEISVNCESLAKRAAEVNKNDGTALEITWDGLKPIEQAIVRRLCEMAITSSEVKISARKISAAIRRDDDSQLRTALPRLRNFGILNPSGHGYFVTPKGVLLFATRKS